MRTLLNIITKSRINSKFVLESNVRSSKKLVSNEWGDFNVCVSFSTITCEVGSLSIYMSK